MANINGYLDCEELAASAYMLINNKANSNSLIQGISGIFGTPITLGVDLMVIGTHYVPMFNEIRTLYGRQPLSDNIILPLIKSMFSECVFDLINDKLLGNIPIIGIYFNVICAKTMTWRLGILFAMLASRGDDIDFDVLSDSVFVIRNVFPQTGAYKMQQPDFDTFIEIVSSVYETKDYDYSQKIRKATAIFR